MRPAGDFFFIQLSNTRVIFIRGTDESASHLIKSLTVCDLHQIININLL